MKSIGFDTPICLGCGHVGPPPEPPYLSCCPERETVTLTEVEQMKKRPNKGPCGRCEFWRETKSKSGFMHSSIGLCERFAKHVETWANHECWEFRLND